MLAIIIVRIAVFNNILIKNYTIQIDISTYNNVLFTSRY